jgi:hypothetical protein
MGVYVNECKEKRGMNNVNAVRNKSSGGEAKGNKRKCGAVLNMELDEECQQYSLWRRNVVSRQT